MLKAEHVVIVGGGFSGTLLAINLLRHGSLKVTLVERDANRLGRGVAYSAAGAEHVLNVRAANMSAFPDQPAHFTDWLKQENLGQEQSFVTRRNYGAYLSALLRNVTAGAGDRLSLLTDEAVDIRCDAAGARIALRSGGVLHADVAVLAPGNLPPHRLPAFAGAVAPHYLDDPWKHDLSAGLTDADDVLLLGTGLTAVDCILSLAGSGFDGRIVAISRRGLSPRSHAPGSAWKPRTERPTGGGAALVRAVRNRAAEVGWRNAVDELRPFTQDIWRAAGDRQRQQFLRHLRPFWDVHRHRIAPPVAERLSALIDDGRLEIRPGKIADVERRESGLCVGVRPRGGDKVEKRLFSRVVNCTGPLGNLALTTDALLSGLHRRGEIRPDAMSIGIDVDQQCRALDRQGKPQDLLVVGPMTRGAHWEIVAVPDIRRQVWALARHMTNSHWVEAEGL